MKAIILNDINDINYGEINKPQMQNGELLVKVKASGICGSDVNRVYKDGAHNMPLIIGHEFAGQVVDAKDEASKHWIGKRVSIFPLIPCKECKQCKQQKYEMCEHYDYIGSRRDGAMAEYVSVPEWNLMELNDNASYEQAAMMEPMAVAVHAMRKVNIEENDNVVVCGLGTIGLLLTMFLHERGVKNLFVIGNKDIQKKAVINLGIPEENFCDARTQKAKDFIKEKSSNNGADVYFECIGSNEAIKNAIDLVAPSGRICFVGNPASDVQLDKNVYWKILRNQLTICGTWNSSYLGDVDDASATNDDWKYCLNKLNMGLIHPEMFISHKFDLENILQGLEIMRDKSEEYIKIMLIND